MATRKNDFSDPISISQGGTGATTVPGVISNLGINLGNRTITGTANEIVVTNGNGIGGNPVLSFAQDAVFPGPGAVTVPSGTTAQRPGTPVLGMMRGNTDSNVTEFYSNGRWEQHIFIDNYLTGLTNTVASTTTMSFSAGQCTDSSNTLFLLNSSTFTKDITVNWAEGTGNGGKPSAVTLANNTVYYTFIIGKDDGTSDFGIDTSVTATNLLSDAAGDGYLYFRRIGSCRTQTGSTSLETIRQYGNYFTYSTPKQDYTAALGAAGTTDLTITLSIPDSIDTIVHCIGASERFSTGSSDTRIYILETASSGVANNYFSHTFFPGSGSNNSEGRLRYEVPSTNGQVRIYSVLTGSAAGNTYVGTIGWEDARGQ